MARPKRLTHETIVWRDAWFGYDNPVVAKDVEFGKYIVTSGWLVRENRDEVVVAMQVFATSDDDRVRHLHGILKRNIISRRSRSVSIADPEHLKS